MNKRRREILAALAPVADVALARTGRLEDDPPNRALNVRNLSADTTELMIYGPIGGGGYFDDGGVTAVQMSDALRGVSTPNVHVRVNSGGGDVCDGVAIHTLLARHPSTVTAFVDGIAASAASFILMAADRIVSAPNAMIMIHDGMTFTYGGPATHKRNLELLEKVSDNIADMYAFRAGGTAEEWRATMSENGEDGTWYTGTEALAAGLVDELVGQEEDEEVMARVRATLPRKVAAHLLPDSPTSTKDDSGERSPESIKQEAEPIVAPRDLNDDNESKRVQDQAFALLAAFNFGKA